MQRWLSLCTKVAKVPGQLVSGDHAVQLRPITARFRSIYSKAGVTQA